MTLQSARTYVVVDTSVLSYFTAQNELGRQYRELLGDRIIALSYFVKTELDARDWGEQRKARLDTLYHECVRLPPTDATSTWYNRANAKRRKLVLASKVSDTDLWIIAHAAEHRIPYMSHDTSACAVAQALGVDALTIPRAD